ncbi:MAG: fatty acid desaturase [Archangium sp.]
MSAATRVGPHWHDERRQQLLATHPEVRELMGHDSKTAVWVFALVALQLALAWQVSMAPWWVSLLMAYFVGAFIAHALGVLVHDAAHDLIFEGAVANRVIAMVANLPLLFPAAMDFRDKHLKHHAHLGEPDGADTQAPQTWDFKFVTNGLKRAVWHQMGPILTHSDAPTSRPSKWIIGNVIVSLVFSGLFFWAFGFKGMLFLGVSGLMAFGHHPVGVRRYGEHLTLKDGQPTTSYYGPLNALSFNVGYHVEHHDLPSVPWSRVKKLHATAPELYKDLGSVKSWTELLWQLTFKNGEGPDKYWLERKPTGVETKKPAVQQQHTQSPA